jgi:hypothetical protein
VTSSLGMRPCGEPGTLQGKDLGAGGPPACDPACDGAGELARVVEAWPELPLHIRVSILALVDAAGCRGGDA